MSIFRDGIFKDKGESKTEISTEELLKQDDEKKKKYVISYIKYYILGVFGQYMSRLDILHFLDNNSQVQLYFDAINNDSDLYDIFDVTNFVYEECLKFAVSKGVIRETQDDIF